MGSFQIILNGHAVHVRELGKGRYRVSMADIDIGNLSRTIVNGQSKWISTTRLKPELAQKIGALIDQFYKV
ncbi:hypothetical protein [Pedobacter duraquae]|uniref:Uncharacterized protein n=1 Tax=Pedobacter duraquae TaxID=425511 RepID=A0A4R6IDY6_9SPHI|nr:hypothetical protein [Pedobacter duraquae]TDO20242.1 hypothetical protein CLV32_4002 [Pedobacter duraquae]